MHFARFVKMQLMMLQLLKEQLKIKQQFLILIHPVTCYGFLLTNITQAPPKKTETIQTQIDRLLSIRNKIIDTYLFSKFYTQKKVIDRTQNVALALSRS